KGNSARPFGHVAEWSGSARDCTSRSWVGITPFCHSVRQHASPHGDGRHARSATLGRDVPVGRLLCHAAWHSRTGLTDQALTATTNLLCGIISGEGGLGARGGFGATHVAPNPPSASPCLPVGWVDGGGSMPRARGDRSSLCPWPSDDPAQPRG